MSIGWFSGKNESPSTGSVVGLRKTSAWAEQLFIACNACNSAFFNGLGGFTNKHSDIQHQGWGITRNQLPRMLQGG